MVLSQGRLFGPLDLLGAAISWPPVSLAAAVFLAGAITILRHRGFRVDARGFDDAARSAHSRYAPEHRALGIAAFVIVLLFLAEFIVRGYVLTGPGVWWWRFAVPIVSAVIGLAVTLGLIATRGSTPPESPAIPSLRRTWLSFNSRSSLIASVIAVLALVGTTIFAGLASAPNGDGQYVWLAIPIPNEADIDPIRLPFYGWAYGVPVLASLAVLLPIAWATLDRNAARPYLRPETVMAERTARRETARGTLLLVTAAALLSLAGAWRLIAGAGSGQYLTVMGQNDNAPYDAAWRYAELAVAAGWGAPLVEIAALTILLLIAANSLLRKSVMPSPATTPHATVEVTG